jgi:hypothetical protein
MEDINGFYKLITDSKRTVMYQCKRVENKNFLLDIGLKDTYTYPIDDWYYFDSLQSACDFFEVNIEDYEIIEENLV